MSHAVEGPVHLAIAILRTIRDWSQKELAKALDVSPDTVSNWERGRGKLLPRSKYLRTLEAMGYPAVMLDRALAFLRDTRLSLGGNAEPPQGAARVARRIEILAAETAQAEADLSRELLTRFLKVVRAQELGCPAAGLTGSETDGATRRLALTVLRIAHDWGQKELARARGVSSRVISAQERSPKDLKLGESARLLAAMGYPPAMLDQALSFVRLALLSLEAQGKALGPDECLEHRIEDFAVRAAAAKTKSALEEATLLVREARILKALAQAPGLFARLEPRTPAERRALVEVGEEFQSWALCLLVCEKSTQAAADDADEALELAELALAVARSVRSEEESFRLRLEGYAQAFMGNSWRVRGNLPRADEAFAEYHQLWLAGGDPECLLAEVRPLDLEASLRREQRLLPEAHDLLDRALETRPTGPVVGRLLLKKAKTYEEAKEYEMAVATLQRAAPFVEAAGDLRLLLVLKSNLLENFLPLGRFSEVEAMLPGVRTLAAQLGNRLDLLRLRWTGGRAAVGTGDLAGAAASLDEVRHDLLALDIPYDTALVSLELSAVYAELNRMPEVEELARQIAPIFRAQRVGREALATLLLFLDAVEQQTLTAALAWRLAADFRRASQEAGAGSYSAANLDLDSPTRAKAPGRAPGGRPARLRR